MGVRAPGAFEGEADMSTSEPRSSESEPHRIDPVARGLSYGLLFGAALSVVFSIALGNPALIGIGAGIGMCIGVAVGSGQAQRRE